MKLRIILFLILLLLSSNVLLAKDPEWLNKMKQIKLLSDNREDVIKLFGNPDNGKESYLWTYNYDYGEISVYYATNKCLIRPEGNEKYIGWKVPEWTVIEISFSPEKHINPKKAFINFNGFIKKPVKYSDDATPDDHRRAPFIFEYDNDELGIHYTEEYGKISEVTFYPSKQFDNLHCDK